MLLCCVDLTDGGGNDDVSAKCLGPKSAQCCHGFLLKEQMKTMTQQSACDAMIHFSFMLKSACSK